MVYLNFLSTILMKKILNVGHFSFLAEIIVESQRNVVISKGTNVVLKCLLSDIDICMWSLNGPRLPDNPRYKYSHLDPEQEKDCTMEISNFEEKDVGEWKCNIYKRHDSHDPDEVKRFWLFLRGEWLGFTLRNNIWFTKYHWMLKIVYYIHSMCRLFAFYFHPEKYLTIFFSLEPQVLMVNESEKALIPYGKPVILLCNFKKEVDCGWTRPGLALGYPMTGSYLNTGQNGRNTKDCSFRIDRFQDNDVGDWQCSGKETNSGKKVSNSPLSLQAGKWTTRNL